jgi:hypothetical protein
VLGALLALAAPGGRARAQEIPKPEYITYMPRETARPVAATHASERFHLFGDASDSAFRDVAPRDGIDDRRGALLHQLGVRFAPWMARNAYGFPMDVRRFITSAATFPLVTDRFDLSRTRPVLTGSDSLDFAQLAGRPCPAGAAPDDPTPDCRLRRLLAERGPDVPVTLGATGADSAPAEVMYFNFPGQDPASWAEEYEGGDHDGVAERYLGWARAYVHPFIAEAAEPGRYEFVLQYWLYYPTNDAGNVHEGDWEHLNVVIAPRAEVQHPLDAPAIERLLGARVPPEDIVIRRVEYYFHHWVYTLDYTRPNLYAPRDGWAREVAALAQTRRGQDAVWAMLRRNAYTDAAESEFNSHPFVFIGGDGRGLNLLLEAPTRLGRSSHGSFPFPGLYKSVGPAGTGESIDQPWSLFREPPAADAPESGRVVRYDHPARIEVLPDWERLTALAREEPEVRRDWAWFLLPARLGYPATRSPFAGVVRYAETGNLSILPPIYSGGWNRMGDGAGYAIYDPHRVSGVFPADVQDVYRTSWGFLNLTVPTISLLPPFDLVLRAVETPVRAVTGREQPSYFRSEDLPFRGIGVAAGTMMFDPGDLFWRLVGFPELATPFLQEAVSRNNGSLAGIGLGPVTQDYLYGWRGELSMHLGRHFVSTNGLGHGYAGMRQDVFISGPTGDSLVSTLDFWEYTGSLRWNLFTDAVEPFLMGGYGISWYRLEDVVAFGAPVGEGASRWVHKPGFWENLLPNTWHIGAGIEMLPVRSVGALDLGVKGSAALHVHNLGLETGNAQTIFFQNATVTRWVFSFTGTLSW